MARQWRDNAPPFRTRRTSLGDETILFRPHRKSPVLDVDWETKRPRFVLVGKCPMLCVVGNSFNEDEAGALRLPVSAAHVSAARIRQPGAKVGAWCVLDKDFRQVIRQIARIFSEVPMLRADWETKRLASSSLRKSECVQLSRIRQAGKPALPVAHTHVRANSLRFVSFSCYFFFFRYEGCGEKGLFCFFLFLFFSRFLCRCLCRRLCRCLRRCLC